MSNPVLFRFRDIRPLNNDSITDSMLSMLVEIPNDRQEHMWIRDNAVGNICLYRDDRYPGRLIEYVQGSMDDSVTTLYEDNGLFETRRQVVDMRNDLIIEIGRVLFALPNTVVVRDDGRERELFLKELGTAQLFDVLTGFSQTDRATV